MQGNREKAFATSSKLPNSKPLMKSDERVFSYFIEPPPLLLFDIVKVLAIGALLISCIALFVYVMLGYYHLYDEALDLFLKFNVYGYTFMYGG